MCLSFGFGKYGCLKYLFPSQEWPRDGAVATHREKKTMKKEACSNQIKAVITSIKLFPNFGGWGPGWEGVQGIYDIELPIPELSHVFLFYLQKERPY